MTSKPQVIAIFRSQDLFLKAVRRLRNENYALDVASSHDMDELEENLATFKGASLFSIVGFCAAFTGLCGGFFMQWYASVIDGPLNIGGRPLNSWVAFIPVTFVLTILAAALALSVTFFIRLKLPHPAHAVFRSSLDFSRIEYGILVQDLTSLVRQENTKELLLSLGADRVEDLL